MVDTKKLRGLIAEAGLTRREVAAALGMTAKTLHVRLKRRVFRTDEAEILIDLLKIEDAAAIFFSREAA